MSYDANWRGRLWPLLTSQVPITVDASGLIGQGKRCAAWVDAVYLYSSFVVVRTCLIARPEQYAHDNGGRVSLVDGGFDDDRPGEVVTTLTVDDQPFSTADRTLQHGDAQTASGRSEAMWWLPHIPGRRLEVACAWPRGTLSGRVVFDAHQWRTAAGAVVTV